MLSLSEIAEATGGDWRNREEAEINGFSIDSRTVSPGDFFITLPGDTTDGEAHLDEGFDRGAVGALVGFKLDDPAFPNLIGVDDRESGFLKMASYYRSRFSVPIVGITGSWGKTTTKEVIASILSRTGTIHKSPGNFNTEYGLPLSLLRMNEETDFGVFELGLQYPGDIEVLSQVLKPTVGLITGIGRVHLKNFDGREQLAREKFRLTEGMEEGATVLLNGDSDFVGGDFMKVGLGEVKPVLYSVEGSAEVRYNAGDIELDGLNGISFSLATEWRGGPRTEKAIRLHSSLLSRANVYNALAGASLALEMGIEEDKIKDGVKVDPLSQRLEPIQFTGGSIINDTYNANPSAVRNALHLLADLDTSGKKILVLGDMLELGPRSSQLHRELAPDVRNSGTDLLLGFGRNVKFLCDELPAVDEEVERDETGPKARWFRGKGELQEYLRENIEGDDNVILVKGSRGMRMEEVVDYLTESGTE